MMRKKQLFSVHEEVEGADRARDRERAAAGHVCARDLGRHENPGVSKTRNLSAAVNSDNTLDNSLLA